LIAIAITAVTVFACLLIKRPSFSGSRSVAFRQQQQSSLTLPAVVVSYPERELREIPALTKRYHLSNRELDVLLLLLGAHKTSRVAEALFISENTVKAHKRHLYQKLGVHTRR
jgi:DNA-binding CsgD family transcriptional regulator